MRILELSICIRQYDHKNIYFIQFPQNNFLKMQMLKKNQTKVYLV